MSSTPHTQDIMVSVTGPAHFVGTELNPSAEAANLFVNVANRQTLLNQVQDDETAESVADAEAEAEDAENKSFAAY